MRTIQIAFLPACCVLIALAGCRQVEPEQAGASAFRGKPGAPISLDYAFAGQPRVAEPLTIDLRFAIGQPGEHVQVFCTASEGLSLRDAQFAFSDLRAGDSRMHAIEVTPQTHGRHHVNVFVHMQSSVGTAARTFAVPVTVGEIRERRENGTLIEDEAGEGIISLPAKEE